MSQASLITMLALVASVAADPYVYGINRPVLASTPAAYNTLGVSGAYSAYPGGYAGYAGYSLPYPLSALSAYESSYGVEELVSAPLVNPAPAPLVYGSYPYASAASYVAPATSYVAPATSYVAPATSYVSPAASYVAPATSYVYTR